MDGLRRVKNEWVKLEPDAHPEFLNCLHGGVLTRAKSLTDRIEDRGVVPSLRRVSLGIILFLLILIFAQTPQGWTGVGTTFSRQRTHGKLCHRLE